MSCDRHGVSGISPTVQNQGFYSQLAIIRNLGSDGVENECAVASISDLEYSSLVD